MLISVYQTSSSLTPCIFLPLKVPKTCEMNKWQTVLLFFPLSPTQLYRCLIALSCIMGITKMWLRMQQAPVCMQHGGKSGLHTQFRLMRILLAMRSSGGSWAYSSGFTYVLIFYPLKAKETHSICMCTCAFCVCVRERACACVHAILYVWSSGDDFTESALSFHLSMSTEEQTQVSRLTQQARLPPELSHSPWNLWHNYNERENWYNKLTHAHLPDSPIANMCQHAVDAHIHPLHNFVCWTVLKETVQSMCIWYLNGAEGINIYTL